MSASNGIGRAWRLVFGALLAAAIMLVWAARAPAEWGSPEGFGQGQLTGPIGVAVDESSGRVYVGTRNLETRLDVFGLEHELLPPSPFGSDASPHYAGTAFASATGHLYALNANEHNLDTIEPATGAELFSFPVPGSGSNGGRALTEIASDSMGNVYVPEPENNRIGVFNEEGGAPSGGVAATIEGSGGHALSGPTGVAVDSKGHVWVADTGDNRLEEFESNGTFVQEIASEGVHAVAVDKSGDVLASVFAASGPQVFEYDSVGVQIEDFGLGPIGREMIAGVPEVNGIAVDSTHHVVYVADGGHNLVWSFTQRPIVATETATHVTPSSAVLQGTVNAGGNPVESCEFEYAPEKAYKNGKMYGHKAPCAQTPAQVGSGRSPVNVSAEIAGLEVDEFYHFRVRASNSFGSTVGSDETFTAIEPVFGFQLSGPRALAIIVSEEASKSEPTLASPEKLDTQAGSHPFDVTSRFFVNTESNSTLPANIHAKDFYVNIPAGFAGSVAKIPRCKMSELNRLYITQPTAGCPTSSQVGVVNLFKGREPGTAGVTEEELRPVYNMVPPPGVPAEIALPVLGGFVVEPIVFQLRPLGPYGGYGITAKVRNISEVLPSLGAQLTLWGVPADPRHNVERFLPDAPAPSNVPAGTAEVPFLTNPTRCGTAKEMEDATVTADSWLRPGQLDENGLPSQNGANWVTASTSMFPQGITGCEKLTFHPEIEVKPNTTATDAGTGMTVDLRVPQSEEPNNYATPSLKEATVTLPQGLAIAPSQARGRAGCTPAQIKLGSLAQPECPEASQIGKLEVVTPLLPEPLKGQVYLSSERQGSTFHIYLVIEGQGVLVKLEGSVHANEETGQLTSTFKENPQLPFSELKLTFFGAGNASLVTPKTCGSYQTTSFFEPWSHNEANGEKHGTPDAEPLAEPFQISSGCVPKFAPGLEAGLENPVAGAYSPLSLTISRNDGEQELSKIQLSLPQGLVAKLAGVEECSDSQIAHAEHNTGAAEKANPSCPVGSQIGTVQTGAGPGSELFFVPGKAYLTGPYRGAPYGVVAIVPALAGPFDLGTVVVRAAINIDPHTTQVTATTDPLPRMLAGIPLQVRRVEVSINRSDFALSPTSCEPTNVTGNLESTQNVRHAVSARFQVGDCASLAFHPGFEVSTGARHTKRFGAALHVKITSGPGQANIKSVLVKLPKQLPSRVSTLKGACAEKQFEENPAGCPAASRVGTAIARTPILSTPLTGPAMFVSHGGAAFPDLDIVLQGSGITVELEGNTNIKHNITTSNFKSAPDVPVSSFELTLPTGPRSALAANGNFCFKTVVKHKHKTKRRVQLLMPTTITGQNGAVVQRDTQVDVEGCGRRGHR